MDKARYAFPGARSSDRVMSEATINAALRRLGYTKKELTGHGFRSTSGTLLNEQGWHRDAIERQLAHAERDSVRAAYNRAEHLPERQKMMQAWADYLDRLRAGTTSDRAAIRFHDIGLRIIEHTDTETIFEGVGERGGRSMNIQNKRNDSKRLCLSNRQTDVCPNPELSQGYP